MGVALGPRILRADTAAVAALDPLAECFGGLAMSFIRPEARRSLRKYRGFIFAGLVLITGLMIAFSSFGTTRLAGAVDRCHGRH